MAYSGNPGKMPIEDSQESVGDVSLPPISSMEGGRKQTSWVWKHFEKRPVEGSSNRYLVHCKICANMKRIQTPFSWNSGSSGTGTLNRHLMNVHGLRSDEGQLEKGQSQISGYATPGGVTPHCLICFSGDAYNLEFEARDSLALDSIKICVMKKDWDAAEERTQNQLALIEDDDIDEWLAMDTSSEATPTASSRATSANVSDQE
nr:zinc finger BED domain-containing protein RICESLEEPER 4-like [Ipomoea batatas]